MGMAPQAAGAGASEGSVRAAEAAWAPYFLPDPALLAAGRLPEPLGYANLARVALIASGVPAAALPAREAALQSRLEAAVEQARAAARPGDASSLAEELLGALHAGILLRYEVDATSLTDILDRGRFNCVSSAVLYLLGLERLGLAGGGVRTADHAFCFVSLPDGRSVDVETTNPYGYDPGTRKEFTDSFGSLTGYSYVPPGAYARRTSIGQRALVGLILSNRSAIVERRGDYRASLGLGVALDALQADADSRAFLFDRINNLVASLVQKRDYAAAEGAAAAAITALGADPRLLELRNTAAYDRVLGIYDAGRYLESLDAAASLAAAGRNSPELASLAEAALGRLLAERIKAGDPAGARRLLEARRELLGAAALGRLSAGLVDAELVAAAGTMEPAAFAEAADRALAAGEIGAARRRELVVYAYGNAATRLAARREWLAAAALAAEGSSRAGGEASLARAAEGFRGNFVAEAHNLFARLYNAGDYRGALAAAEAGLALLPGNPTLSADRGLAEKARR
jgi:hypothetical protein